MTTTNLITIVTFIVMLILGIFAKKSIFIKNEMIPLQNLLVGLIMVVKVNIKM